MMFQLYFSKKKENKKKKPKKKETKGEKNNIFYNICTNFGFESLEIAHGKKNRNTNSFQ